MTTDITELTPESARESGSILIIVAARMARREFFTPLHALCESGKRVVSTRALCDAVERAEEHMVSQVSKIVDGHDRLTKKLKEAESRNADLVEALEKAQRANAAQDDHINQQQDRIEQLEKGHQKAAKQINSWRRMAKQNIAEREKDIVELDAARQRIAELESRTVKLPKPHAHLIWIQAGHAPDDYWDDVAVSHSEKDLCCDGSERYPVYARWEIEEMLAAAGIKVEVE
ncbi:TPA: hypothetical protein QHY55_000761 [Klebsiella pneumoniae subsp. pneumoniae]|nr:hypothetical protein [Klebsiella pneumoniae subsp. pneumoniae]